MTLLMYPCDKYGFLARNWGVLAFCFERLYGVTCIMASASSHRELAASGRVAVIMRGIERW